MDAGFNAAGYIFHDLCGVEVIAVPDEPRDDEFGIGVDPNECPDVSGRIVDPPDIFPVVFFGVDEAPELINLYQFGMEVPGVVVVPMAACCSRP